MVEPEMWRYQRYKGATAQPATCSWVSSYRQRWALPVVVQGIGNCTIQYAAHMQNIDAAATQSQQHMQHCHSMQCCSNPLVPRHSCNSNTTNCSASLPYLCSTVHNVTMLLIGWHASCAEQARHASTSPPAGLSSLHTSKSCSSRSSCDSKRQVQSVCPAAVAAVLPCSRAAHAGHCRCPR